MFRKEAKPVIDNIFPLSEVAVFTGYDQLVEHAVRTGGKDHSKVRNIQKAIARDNPNLHVFSEGIANLLSGLYPTRFYRPDYLYGREISYRIFIEEARARGGILPRISDEALGVFIRDTLHIVPDQNQRPIQALRRVATDVRKISQQIRTTPLEELSDVDTSTWSPQAIGFMEYITSDPFDNSITERIDELKQNDEFYYTVYIAHYAEDFTRIHPGIDTDAFVLAQLDMYKIFRNHLEARRLEQLMKSDT